VPVTGAGASETLCTKSIGCGSSSAAATAAAMPKATATSNAMNNSRGTLLGLCFIAFPPSTI
jgi:hypothetical protein